MSEHFSLAELCFSQWAVRNGYDNIPPEDVIGNLGALSDVLEEVRAVVGKPIIISSGYRSSPVNAAIGGSPTSAHVRGLAADITVKGMPALTLAKMIRNSGLQYDQLIYEGSWVHLGISTGKPRMQDLTAHFVNGKTLYTQGIE